MFTNSEAKFVFCFFLLSLIRSSTLDDVELTINVQNQGGDVLQETISANVSEDTVTLEFQRTDGTLVTQLLDFRNDVQILKALILGEEERGQSQYQVVCFVCHFNKEDFISPEAIAKLRQKNPGTVRTPEEDKRRENITMDSFMNVGRSGVLSQHVVSMCSEASDATYTRQSDILMWAAHPGASLSSLLGIASHFSSQNSGDADRRDVARCLETASLWAPCMCHLEICIGWYPCGLKYCKNRGENRSVSSSGTYRCGIKTCRKCSLFSYYVRQKQLCLWDE